MQLQYNYLNLLEKAEATIPAADPNDPNTPATTESASYTWLADGTKAAVVDQDGNGYVYLGSLIYKRLPDGTLELESTAHGSGRIVVRDDPNNPGQKLYETQYHITDHLGSVRVVINQDGEVLARNDYYPFGKSHNNPSLMAGLTNPATPEANRFLFNGKEKQLTGNLGLLDYGARMYDNETVRWFGMDQLAEKHFTLSPYEYCYNNPVNVVDPDGKDGIFVVFPKYKANGYPLTGHAGVLLINNKTGGTRYYEYGRYSSDFGNVRNYPVPDVEIVDGEPTIESLDTVLGYISEISGKGQAVEGAYVESDNFDAMNDYAEEIMNDQNREPYNILTNNCGTFADDVISQDEEVSTPILNDPRPVDMIKKYQNKFKKVSHDPKIGTAIHNNNNTTFYDRQNRETTKKKKTWFEELMDF